MQIVGSFLLALLIIAEYIGAGVKKAAKAVQFVIRWSWVSVFGSIVAIIGATVIWMRLSSHTSPFLAWSTFITLLAVVVYVGRFLYLIVTLDPHEERERPRQRHQPLRPIDWCEPTPAD
jgi:hypothetical protein